MSGPSRKRFFAQVEGDGDSRAVALVRKDQMRDVAGKQNHQSRLRPDIDARRHRAFATGKERGASPLAGI